MTRTSLFGRERWRLAPKDGTRVIAGSPLPAPVAAGEQRTESGCLMPEALKALVAERLYLSPETVRNDVSCVLAKLQVTEGVEAIVRAREAGVGEEPTE